MKPLRPLVWLICFALLFVACGQTGDGTAVGPTPTAGTPAAIISPTPTEHRSPESPAPEPTPADTATSAAAGAVTSTAVASATDTAVPTATPEPTATPTPGPMTTPAQPVIFIDYPAAEAELLAGDEITINGHALPPLPETVHVRITAAGGAEVFDETTPVEADTGNWSVTAVLSPTLSGPAELAVLLPNAGGVSQPVTLIAATDSEQPSITLRRPTMVDTAVVGYILLFEGQINHPINGMVTIALLDNNCISTAATQSFPVSDGDWIGYLIISTQAVPGPACAIAYTGTPGQPTMREARVPLTLLAAEDSRALILQLGNNEMAFQAGNSTYLFGIAINAPGREVNIRLETEAETEIEDTLETATPAPKLITSATAFADQFGFWEIDLEIPEDAASEALLFITIGRAGAPYREIRRSVTIQ